MQPQQPDGIFRIKVLRVTPPKLYLSNLKSINFPLSFQNDAKTLEQQFTPFYLQNNYFQLNTDFGKVYVGEALKVIVSITNISHLPAESASIQAELFTDAKVPPGKDGTPQVKESSHLKNMTLTHVKPNDPIVFVLEFRLEEPDTFHLGFKIFYKQELLSATAPNGTQVLERVQDKKFRFDARLPFLVSYRVYRIMDKEKVFLEVKIEQQTKQILFFKNIKFIPSTAYEIIEYDKDLSNQKDKLSLNPTENFKLVYQLKYKSSKLNVGPNKAHTTQSFVSGVEIYNIGQLLFEWFNVINEAGSMYSKMITMTPVEHEVTMKFVDLPKTLHKEVISSQEAIITNSTDKELDLLLNLFEKDMVGVKIIGLSRYELKVGARKSEKIVLFVLPVLLGIQKFSGLRIFNRLTQKEVPFGSLGDIIVMDNEADDEAEIKPHEAEKKNQIVDLL